MSNSPLRFTMREMRAQMTNRATQIVLLGLAMVFGLSGPFGTFDALEPLPRLLYWAVVVLSTYAIGTATANLVKFGLTPTGMNPWILALVEGFVGGVPVALCVLGINLVVMGDLGINPWHLLAYCMIICAGAIIITRLVERARVPVAQTAAAPAPQPPAILQRLPLPQRGKLQQISVADHYVEITTDKGHGLVLMRLGDAIGETGAVEGLQIHRSHWVALDAVVRCIRVDGKPMVEMVNGTRLPISRSFLPAVKAAGLIP
ncbi:LytTR family DNA-binding domain-containing protein [Devosia rhodophyticola]|uniref:LytTR family DNA-binding domain-containing protein n=1 Tax=Devosia rhodophyticola TaxID=3026423 RepID=A0ABY7Z1N6_9HYPH|nr:LytTR family DNA-binding domain-containing protein [Devosia rhodophyticola]WDR07120.1 LytTR family DNA-binding domain-containing protein [Devosia rhodophyticola]